jgi:TonB family protein
MLNKIITITFIIASYTFSQDGLVKSYFPNDKIESEINYVNKVKEGPAKYYYPNGHIRQELSYVNGKVDGLVKEYFENGILKLTYTLENGKKEGRASIFKEDGTFLTDIPYSRGKRIIETLNYNTVEADTGINIAENVGEEKSETVPPLIAEDTIKTDSVYATAEVMPEPVGGMNGIYKRLVYPKPAQEKNVEGVVNIEVLINQAGDVVESIILNDIGYGCGESAKITLFYTKFKPGLQRGKPIMIRMVIPVTFKLTSKIPE